LSNNKTEKNRKLNVKNKGQDFGSRHDNDIKVVIFTASIENLWCYIYYRFSVWILQPKSRKRNLYDTSRKNEET